MVSSGSYKGKKKERVGESLLYRIGLSWCIFSRKPFWENAGCLVCSPDRAGEDGGDAQGELPPGGPGQPYVVGAGIYDEKAKIEDLDRLAGG